jgi:hypothetical protein
MVELASREYVNLTVSPGSHVVAEYRSKKVTVDAVAGQSYYLKVWLGLGIINPPSHLSLVTPASAAKEISCCHLLSPSSWLSPDPAVRAADEADNPGDAAFVTLVGADWIPNSSQDGGWDIYDATITADHYGIRIAVNAPAATGRAVYIPMTAVASVEYVTYRHGCWLTLRRTSGHVEQFRANDCPALEQFGERLGPLIGASHR